MSVKKLIKILANCKSKGITVQLDASGNNLSVRGNVKDLSDADKGDIRENKDALVEFLKSQRKSSKIEPIFTQEGKGYDLSVNQENLWIESQFTGGGQVYNMPFSIEMDASKDKVLLEKAVRAAIERHEILRTVFKETAGGEIQQHVLTSNELKFSIGTIDFRNSENPVLQVEAFVKEDSHKPFDLENGPLIRACFLQISDDKIIFYHNMHHIISDGWSSNVLLRDVMSYFTAFEKGENSPSLPELRIQYKDFANWQRSELKNGGFDQHKKYWLDKFEGERATLKLPQMKLAQNHSKSFAGHKYTLMLSEKVSRAIQSYSKDKGGSLFMGLLATWNSLLSIYSAENDIVIGSVLAGREFSELENQIGFYVNTIAFRNLIEDGDSFDQIFENTQKNTLEAYKHQMYPFSEILDELSLKDGSGSSLFDVMFILENQSESTEISTTSVKEGIIDEGETLAKFKLGITMWENNDRIGLDITFNTVVYETTLIENLMEHYNVLLEKLVEQPSTPIHQLDFLSQDEKEAFLAESSSLSTTGNPDQTLVDLFQDQVARTPDETALLFEDVKLTYMELDELSNQFAHYLSSEYELQPNELISIKLERSQWTLVTILGILKTGSAYVPIDTSYPEDRITFIESDSECRVKVDGDELKKFQANEYSSDKFVAKTLASDIAYIIYTSGSTGKPKGVMIEHGSACAMINWSLEEFADSDFDATLFVTSYCFDLSIFEMFYTLSAGKQLQILKDALELENYLRTGKKWLLNTVPSVVGKLLNENVDLSSVSVLNMAGESIPPSYIPLLLPQCKEIRNLYGPSEDTTYSTCYRIDSEGKILIGKPISNTAIYVLNESNNLLPNGVAGELALSGSGLARAYLNRPELTAEKFVKSPFVEGERMYKTGDLGRRLPDGNIEFIGRKDDQVKVRGYRIELGEIEYALSQIESINEAVVVVKENKKGEQHLVGFITTHQDLTSSQIREFLGNLLPAYMIPSIFVPMEEFPLSANGKIDKKKLPNPEGANLPMGMEYVAPKNHVENTLVDIWQETLNIERVGVTDNFFDLGGHSLIVGQIINKSYKQLNGKISYTDFFKEPTIQGIANIISEEHYFEIPQLPKMDGYQLSRAQHRFWVLNQIEEGNPAYNITVVLTFKGDIITEKFNRALELMIEKHEILRTCFPVDDDNQVFQIVHTPENSNFKMSILDYQDKPESEVLSYIEKEQQNIFDFSNGPLIRASLIQVGPEEYVFSFVMHHIIGDGWSIRLMMSEIISLYQKLLKDENIQIETPKVQYKEYAHWSNDLISQPPYKKAEEYWMKQLSGYLPSIDLPSFKKRPSVQTYNGDHLKMRYSKEFVKELVGYSKENESTLFMTLVASINTLIWRYTGQDDIILGTPISSREHPDLEDQLGLYLNTLAIRTKIEPDFSFKDLLNVQKKVLLEAYHHQVYPFDEIVSKLSLGRDASRPPIFNILIALQSQNQVHSIVYGDDELMGFEVQEYKTERKSSQFDISFTFIETSLGLELEVIFNPDVYSKNLAQQFVSQFKALAEEVTINDEVKLSSIDLVEKENVILKGYSPYESFDQVLLSSWMIEENGQAKLDSFCIVNEENVPQPEGVVGEICVKVRADSTLESFGNRFKYRGIEFVRTTVNGAIEGNHVHCISTKDENAYSLLEKRINSHNAIIDCLFETKESPILYCVPETGREDEVALLFENYKVHNSILISDIQFLNEETLNVSGKIDLGAFEFADEGIQEDKESSVLEKELLEFAATLFVDKELFPQTNFFEIGGNSMQIILLLMQVQKDYNVDIKPHQFFGNPTIAFLSGEIEKMELLKSGNEKSNSSSNKITI